MRSVGYNGYNGNKQINWQEEVERKFYKHCKYIVEVYVCEDRTIPQINVPIDNIQQRETIKQQL